MSRKSASQKVALCGVLSALSIALMLVGEMLQLATYCAPIAVALLIIPPLEEFGAKYALLQYITVSILALILIPELEMTFFYLFLTGYYPVLKKKLDRIRSGVLRKFLKLFIYLAALFSMYAMLIFFFLPGLAQELLSEGTAVTVLIFSMLLITLCINDVLLDRFTRIYLQIFKTRFKNLF